MATFFEKLNELALSNIPFVSVTLVDAQGSVPQEIGAKMLVTAEGLAHGTVGGGKVEKRAIEEAQGLLQSGGASANTKFLTWALDRDIGMTCGGSVKLFFEAFNLNVWSITVFGAGHVANSLLNMLINLDCKVTCVDPREEWLDKLPDTRKLQKVLTDDMPAYARSVPPESFVVLMTMGHTTDKPILLELLKRGVQFPYLGVIGSRAKAARLHKDVIDAGLPAEKQSSFLCPIGLEIGTNHPQEIAVSVAAQLLQARDRWRSNGTEITTAKEEVPSKIRAEQFTSLAAHDMQEPLRTMSGYLMLLEEHCRGALDDKARSLIYAAVESAGRMQGMIEQLLEFARMDGAATGDQRIDCNALVKEVLASLDGSIQLSKAEIHVEALPVVSGEASQIRTLFQNVIENAIKFHKPEVPPVIRVSWEGKMPSGNLIAVRDEGIGIDMRFADDIFTQFRRLNSGADFAGNGIGLALCKKIVEGHGGKFWLESAPGNGSTFYFTLPLP
jgi:xanthine dehydrogenase accessory factor